jgi:hypothetical protein
MFKGITHYKKFLNEFTNVEKQSYDSSKTDVTMALYKDWFEMHSATWEHAIKTGRDTRLALADIFQDLLVHFLDTFLPQEYNAIPEYTIQSKPKLKVDIAVKKNNKICFLIEVKTTLGWDRGSIDNRMSKDDISELKVVKRREQIAKATGIDKENVIYIFSSFQNTTPYFREQFWIKESRSDLGRPIPLNERRQDEPFNFIYPMFNQYDPRYITKTKHLKLYNDDEITNLAKENICTPFEYVLDLIKLKKD